MFRSLIFGILLSWVTNCKTQDIKMVDSLSEIMYSEKRWDDLAHLMKEIDLKKIKSSSLYYKASVAAFETGLYCKSEEFARQSLLLSDNETIIKSLLSASLLYQGKTAQSVWVGRQEFGFGSKSLLSEINVNGGLKYSAFSEPGSLSHVGMMTLSRFNYAFNWRNFISYNTQNYFWENMNQWNWTSTPMFTINSKWQLNFPFQMAIYKANIDYQSKQSTPSFTSQGNINQTAYHIGAQAEYNKNYFRAIIGYSHAQASLNNDFETRFQLSGNDVNQITRNTVNTDQNQLSTYLSYKIPTFKERLSLGLESHLIQTQKASYILAIPEVAYRFSKKINAYINYWKKSHYMVLLPQAGVFINNANTSTQRILLQTSYWIKSTSKFDLAYMYEWGTDDLYKQKLEYQGIFITFTYFLKP